jgi:hypothetical protein
LTLAVGSFLRHAHYAESSWSRVLSGKLPNSGDRPFRSGRPLSCSRSRCSQPGAGSAPDCERGRFCTRGRLLVSGAMPDDCASDNHATMSVFPARNSCHSPALSFLWPLISGPRLLRALSGALDRAVASSRWRAADIRSILAAGPRRLSAARGAQDCSSSRGYSGCPSKPAQPSLAEPGPPGPWYLGNRLSGAAGSRGGHRPAWERWPREPALAARLHPGLLR